MSGLLALLDDVAAIAKLAAASLDDAAAQAVKASTKAAGVVIDDAAVTPRYVTGLAAKRELPIIGRIALGSLKNKLLILLPVALLLSAFLPSAIMPLLMLGALFLCYEGYEKVHHMLAAPADPHGAQAAIEAVKDDKALEDEKVNGAIRTDFILSAEIMAIALAEITAPGLVTQAVVLALVGIGITAGVYGVVALIVKADDFGVYLVDQGGPVSGAIGRALVNGMPPFLRVLSLVGTLAMLWVGGGILLHGFAALGFAWPEHVVHDAAAWVGSAMPAASSFFAWLTSAIGGAIVGLAAGAVTALIVTPLLGMFGKTAAAKH
jgi:predicted DNA repair protein MutK